MMVKELDTLSFFFLRNSNHNFTDFYVINLFLPFTFSLTLLSYFSKIVGMWREIDMKKGLVIVLSALVLASCGRPQRTVTPKSSDTKQTSTSEKKQSGMDLKAIKAKDYSSIKGTWIDGRGNELVFDDKGLVSEDVELDASSFKQKDQIAEMTVSAKSGVGGYGLLLLPKGQIAGKDDASDKSKDRIWAGQSPAYGDDDNFYYRKKEQPKDREQVDTDDSSSTSKTSKAKKWNTRSDGEVKSSKKAGQNDYPGYTDAQVEAARVWAYVIKNVPSELNISNSAAGTKIYNGGLGVDYPKDVRHLFGSYSAEGNITYASNGDGTVTIYPVPSHWQQSADELNSEEFMTQFTQGILDHAETVTLPDGDPDMIRQILAVLK